MLTKVANLQTSLQRLGQSDRLWVGHFPFASVLLYQESSFQVNKVSHDPSKAQSLVRRSRIYLGCLKIEYSLILVKIEKKINWEKNL